MEGLDVVDVARGVEVLERPRALLVRLLLTLLLRLVEKIRQTAATILDIDVSVTSMREMTALSRYT
jgi:hypothetical protein